MTEPTDNHENEPQLPSIGGRWTNNHRPREIRADRTETGHLIGGELDTHDQLERELRNGKSNYPAR